MAAVGLYALLRWNPVSWITQLYTVFIITFGLVWLLSPGRFFRRMSGAALTAAGAAAAIPTINAQISLPGWLAASFVVEGAGWLAPVLAAVSLGFGLLELWRQQPSPASTSAGGDIVKVGDGGSYTKIVGAVDPGTLAKIVDRYDQDVKERDTSLAESKERIQDLEAALARVNTEADKGDPQAKAAIEEARKSGDATKLQAALIAQADRRQQQIRDDAADYLELCREIAAIAHLRGDLDEARKRLEAITRLIPNDRDAINRLGHIHRVQGRLDEAERSYRRVLELSADDETWRAVAYGNLGLIHLTRGDLDKAEQMFHRVLEIEEKLGRSDSMANAYGNLGLIHRTRGDLDQAEEMHRKSLAIEEKLGRLEGMASDYGNLGVIHQTRGELDKAEEMLRKGLAIEEKLGRLEGMASEYGNLGLIHQTRGDLDKAEQMHRKSLEIEKKLGRLEGMASEYGNLGLIHQTRGDLDKAEEMHRKSLEIEEKLGRLEGMANQYGNLGLIHQTRGDLDKAEEMLRKALKINEKLGRLEGMASAYGNLGLVAEERGDLVEARKLWIKARDLFEKIGVPHMVAQMQGWIDDLPPDDPQ